MHRLASGLRIAINIHPAASLDSQRITKFERLARITKISINGEKTACDNEKAYAQVAAPWIPVKCYYHLYYLEAIFVYLLMDSEAGFGNGGHKGVRKALRELINTRTITLSVVELATISDWATANTFRAMSGSTISANYFSTTNCPRSLNKKLAEYIEVDWRQARRIDSYRTSAARALKTRELLPKKFILLDYFYWMRIKANYRDVDFLDFDKDINEHDAYEYLCKFIEATHAYSNALEAAIAQLKIQRGMT